jgi:membrane-bound inhibitor of C-type lysozyme
MKLLGAVPAVLFGAALSTPCLAAPKQPPMDQFNNAFYTCDGGGAFLMSYDSSKPNAATMTTSNNNRKFELKRSAVSDGVQFAGGPVKFWTDGKSVTVEGTELPLQHCSTKAKSD